MKRFILILLLALAAGLTARAQVELSEVVGRLGYNRIMAEFSCSIKKDVVIECRGTALAQENRFVVKANGIEAYCNGSRLVLVDPVAKEVYVESAAGLEKFLQSNMGSVTDLRFYELRFLDKSEDLSVFEFNTESLDSSWIVTDLRQE